VQTVLLHAQKIHWLISMQSCWDKPIIDIEANNLSNLVTDDYHRARLKAGAAPHASDWLFALPITSCGLTLEDEALRVAVGLRLGSTSASLMSAAAVSRSRPMALMGLLAP
jgi:hypothetical protein